MEEKSYHHGNLREALIEAGITIISSEGLAQLSMRKVAACCKVSHAAPYKHFKNKDELLSAIKMYISQGVTLYLQESLPLNGTDEEKLLAFGKSYVDYFVEHPSYYRFIFMQSDYKFSIKKDNVRCENFDLLSAFIDIVKNLTNKENDEIVVNIITMLAVVNGLISLFVSQNIQIDIDYKEIVDKVLREKLKL